MQQNRVVRIIKRGQKANEDANIVKAASAVNAEPSERELKSVVSGWISEHRQRSEEYRRAFADLLRESGFRSPRATTPA